MIFLRQYDQVSGAKKESLQFEKVQEQLKCKPGRQHYDKSQGMLLIVMYLCARIMAMILFEEVISGY